MTRRQRELPLSVNVSLPVRCEALIERRLAAADARGQIESWTTIIHDALWEVRNRGKTKAERRRELEEAILEGINSGPGIPVTPAFWKNMRARLRRRHKKIEAARAEGLVGNLRLPKELFAFIQEETASGYFASATEVVREALRSEPMLRVEESVLDRYSRGAERREENLCCAVAYDQRYLEVIPAEARDACDGNGSCC